VVLTHRFWQRQFGGAPGVVDSSVTLSGAPYTVVGVMPPGFRFPSEQVDVFVPHSTIPDQSIPRLRVVRVLEVIARARPNAPMEAIQSEMSTITRRLAQQYSENTAWDGATVRPLREAITGQVRRSMLVLWGAVGFVLLMACVNVSSLQLARASVRGREIAVRTALGARRGRIVRQLLTESLVLALIGGLAGIASARLGVAGLLALSAGQLPRAFEVRLDAGVLAFGLGISLAAGLLFGLLPALRASATAVTLSFREGGRGTAGVESNRVRNGLVVAEVSLAVMLVLGAGLMVRSFIALQRVDPGFRAENLLAVNFTINPARHPGESYSLVYQRMIERVRAIPGVISAGAVKDAPFRGSGERNGFALPGMVIPAGQDPPTATILHVSDGYFHTIGARMREGREFTPHDRADAPFVIVVNDAFARQWFPGERAVGKTVLFGPTGRAEIVGVVKDIRQIAVAEPARPTIYIDNQQNSRVKTTIVVRTRGTPLALAPAVREAVWSVDRNQPITSVFTFDEAMHDALARPRLLTVLLGAFGALGLILGSLGIYGVLAYLVSQRQREIGVRLALGSRPVDVSRLVVRRGLGLAAVGVAIGLAGGSALAGTLATILYRVEPHDPLTIGVVVLLLMGVATLASWIPARRAAKVDPMLVIRE
jgi:predicted permease